MPTSKEIITEILYAHLDVVSAEANLARDEDSQIHYSRSLPRVEKANKRFEKAMDALREHLANVEG